MKTNKIMKSATRTMNKVGLKVKKYSPEILIVAGIIGTVTSAVMACKATTKVNDILDESKAQLARVHVAKERLENNEVLKLRDGGTYTQADVKKDLTIVYTRTAIKFVKLYAPSVALGALSLACIVKSNNILHKRNVALAAAYATVDRGFKEYRSRVVDRFGSAVDKELRYNIKAKEFDTVNIDEETGEEKIVKEVVDVVDPNLYSEFARHYDDGCTGWCKDPEANLTFLKLQQSFANDKLKERGYLFLNEVYAMLGIPKSKAGQVVGWIYDEKNPIGDNFVDFGIYNSNIESARNFVNGYERTIILDFNVDGNILDMI